MADPNLIENARDVLAKWADATTPRPWAVEEIPETGECRIVMVDEDVDAPTIVTVTSGGMTRADASLIVGTAGNPDLLDAIDAQFAFCLAHPGFDVIASFVHKLAAAIIAADKRMSNG